MGTLDPYNGHDDNGRKCVEGAEVESHLVGLDLVRDEREGGEKTHHTRLAGVY